jgi:hypothetical protein
MSEARLAVTLPEGTWIGDCSREFPDVEFRVLASLPAEERGIGLVELRAGESPADPPTVIEAVRGHGTVAALDALSVADDRALLRFETGRPLLLLSATAAGIPLEPPVTIADGRASLSVTAPRGRIATLCDQLDAFGVRYDLRYVREAADPADLLTDHQRRLVERAVELGYYEVPRDCTLTALADDLGIAKATASESLARAERRIVHEYLADAGRVEPPA